MTLRSWLFVPGDSPKKLGKGDASRADALILDLEDSVAPDNKAAARDLVPAYMAERPRETRVSQLWVRINPLDTEYALADLAAIVAAGPDGVMLPKADGPAEVQRLSYYLDALEAQTGVAAGSIGILPVATETAKAPFRLGDYADAGLARLRGLTWGAEDLSAAIRASTNLDAGGQWTLTYRMARSLTLLAAHAADVQAIETLYVDYSDEAGLREFCRRARAEGFSGQIAIHPAQVAAINESYTPSSAEVDHARRVVEAFEAAGGAGVVGLDGKMLDRPHLKQANAVLAAWEAFSKVPSGQTSTGAPS
jgi:citrate lyase subunit beta/citryl-CoA lyase